MKYLVVVAALIISFASCKNEDQFVIEGQLKRASGIRMVALHEDKVALDSSFLTEDGRFRFTGSSPEPAFYTITAGERTYFLVLANGEHVQFEADMADENGAYEISGSATSGKMKEFSLINSRHMAISKKIQEEFESKSGNASPEEVDRIRDEYRPQYQQNLDEFSAAVLAFVKENQDNLAGFFAMSSIDPRKHEQEVIAYAETIEGKFGNNKYVKEFLTNTAAIKRVSIGQKAPDFESHTPEGKKVKPSDFRGKYLLLDFWASWCVPCRQENPNIVKQYKTYKGRGFEILGISLDHTRADWLQGIADDGLVWEQVSDLNFWDTHAVTLYQVQGIPASFLLDPEGVIIAKNLRGEELGAFLQKTLPQ